MTKAQVRRWIRELPKYRKGKATLCRITPEGQEEWCCLGVVADLFIDTDWVAHPDMPILWALEDATHFLHTSLIPKLMGNKLGISWEQQQILSEVNDRANTWEPVIAKIKAMFLK
jgi:hypothetical protein